MVVLLALRPDTVLSLGVLDEAWASESSLDIVIVLLTLRPNTVLNLMIASVASNPATKSKTEASQWSESEGVGQAESRGEGRRREVEVVLTALTAGTVLELSLSLVLGGDPGHQHTQQHQPRLHLQQKEDL